MTKKWRVAILGLGHWYSAYNLVRALREYDKAELVAVAWHNATQLAEFSTTFGVRGYADYETLLAREELDLVHLAAPVAELPALTIMAARAGKHLVLGKPMAMTLAQADEMVAAVAQAGVKCVAFQGLKRLQSAKLKARIEAGEIGDILVMHQTARWSIAEDWYRSGQPGWFVDPAQVPGGAFIDEGIYWMDFLRWLAGSEIVQVEAKMANLVHRALAVEDWGMATFTFANGIVATLEAAWTINAPHATGPSPKRNAVLRTEIIGTRGEIIEDSLRSPSRAVLAAGAANWVYERESAEILSAPAPFPLDHLIECVERDLPSPASIEEARASLRVALAAYEAAREGRSVRLSD
ncbi:MAG: Gfo/Idh/MocA family oxidoreductase [Acidobacteria bacterium]|nr:Gfo/Idh/MocA family oxidoreductase [Acidobacteriota bacterium]MBI3423310.1 Gfo/Idh/MocA family oxidoreductase [Acidobacteriota bacterium]